MRYHYTPLELLKLKSPTLPSAGEEVNKLTSHSALVNIKWHNHFEKNIWEFLKELNIHLPYDPLISCQSFSQAK